MNYIYTLNEELEKYKYWIIYGSGVAATELYMTIVEKGGHVEYFCDLDESCIGRILFNKSVISVEKVRELGLDACLIVCREYMPFIMEELKKYQINNIFVQDVED